MADGEHPRPDLLMAFVEKMAKAIGPNYVMRTAEFLKREYPATAAALRPRLAALYREARRK